VSAKKAKNSDSVNPSAAREQEQKRQGVGDGQISERRQSEPEGGVDLGSRRHDAAG
jgi:hypothetical protein